VPFPHRDKNVRPDGVLQVKGRSRTWTALIEVKTGANELKAAQMESHLDVARDQGFDAMLTISSQLARAPGEHPLAVDKRKLRKVSLHHLSWSQIRTEALIEQANKVVSDPDQAWILAEYTRYLEHGVQAPRTLTTWVPPGLRSATRPEPPPCSQPLTPGRTTIQAPIPPGTDQFIAMDWQDGRLAGIEILDATRHLHDDLLQAADTE
jgi:hypothetical protein